MKHFGKFAVLSLAVLGAACGGGSGGGSSSVPSLISAQFIDAPVKGLNIAKASGNAVSGDRGIFTCEPGEQLTFSLRNLQIGVGPCGSKIFLDDVVSSRTADAVATVLQSLSVTNPADGLIDLTAIPANKDLSTIDLSAGETAVTSAISAIRTELSGVAFAPLVTYTEARNHVNAQLAQNIPADLASDLAEIAGSGIRLRATKTSGPIDDCWQYTDATMSVVSTGVSGVYRAEFDPETIISYDDPSHSSCSMEQQGQGLCGIGSQFIEGLSKIISSRQLTLGLDVAYVYRIVNPGAEVNNLGVIRSFAGVAEPEILFTFSSNDDQMTPQPIVAVNGNFPLTQTESLRLSIDFSNYPESVSGTMVETDQDLEMGRYTSQNSYVLDITNSTCRYTIGLNPDPVPSR